MTSHIGLGRAESDLRNQAIGALEEIRAQAEAVEHSHSEELANTRMAEQDFQRRAQEHFDRCTSELNHARSACRTHEEDKERATTRLRTELQEAQQAAMLYKNEAGQARSNPFGAVTLVSGGNASAGGIGSLFNFGLPGTSTPNGSWIDGAASTAATPSGSVVGAPTFRAGLTPVPEINALAATATQTEAARTTTVTSGGTASAGTGGGTVSFSLGGGSASAPSTEGRGGGGGGGDPDPPPPPSLPEHGDGGDNNKKKKKKDKDKKSKDPA